MNLKQCQQRLKFREYDLVSEKDSLESSLEEINFYTDKIKWSLEKIKDLEKEIKGLRNLIMQLEGE